MKNKAVHLQILIIALGLIISQCTRRANLDNELTLAELQDRIAGGWAGQTIGCVFGGPTEFRFRGTFIQDYQPIP